MSAYDVWNPASIADEIPMTEFDQKLHLLQSLSMPAIIAKGSVFEHFRNGTWTELCPSVSRWHYKSDDGRFYADVDWKACTVTFSRVLAKKRSNNG